MKKSILLILIFAIGLFFINTEFADAAIGEEECSLNKPCGEGKECFSFPGMGFRCADPNPCGYYNCPSNTQCVVAEIYPGKVMCSCVGDECQATSEDEKSVTYDISIQTAIRSIDQSGNTVLKDITIYTSPEKPVEPLSYGEGERQDDFVPGIIAWFKFEVTKDEALNLIESFGLPDYKISEPGWDEDSWADNIKGMVVIKVPQGSEEEYIQKFKDSAIVEIVQLNYRVDGQDQEYGSGIYEQEKGILQTQTMEIEYEGNLIVEDDTLFMKLSEQDKKEIKVMPEDAVGLAEISPSEVKEIKLQEKQSKPVYSIKSTKEAKIFAIFSTSMEIETKVDAGNGNIISVTKPWWGFLAR